METQTNPTLDVIRELALTRVINAPRELVFKLWTEHALMARWWGPKHFANPVCDLDVRVGGEIYVEMESPDGTLYPMGGEYVAIEPPRRLVMITKALPNDAEGTWGLENLNVITFRERGGRTTIAVRVEVLSATEEAEPCLAGMEAGWSQSLDKLAALADELQQRQHQQQSTNPKWSNSTMAENQNIPATLVGDREIMAVRHFDAPRELVYRAWTEQNQVEQWWGPQGFTTTTSLHEVKPGGVWRFVMHGPDGRDYQNKITYLEVVPNERLVYKHGGDKDVEPVNFSVTVTFDEVGANKTKLTMRMQFPNAAARDYVIKTYGAAEGLNETLGRLTKYIAAPASKPFTISRTFDAPLQVVWDAWTQREQLMQWFGPKGFTMPTAKLDLRPGGDFHYQLLGPNDLEMWGKFTYREIVPLRRMVWLHTFSDASGGLMRHPLSATWPVKMLSTATFSERDGKTTVTIEMIALEASAQEQKTFDDSHGGMQQGWTGTFEQLAEYLKNR